MQLPSLKKCSAVYDHSLGSHGLVHVTGLLDTDTILPFSKYSCPLVSLRYRVLDLHSLRRHTGARKTQNFVESQKTKEFRRLLDREEEDHGDLMFVPVLDSRVNNTQKLKLYSKHLVESVDFDHLLLTDDTTFLFPHNILSKLRTMSSPKLWWSDFEVFKKTEYEQESSAGRYTSATYPPLPRSPAMILSQVGVFNFELNVFGNEKGLTQFVFCGVLCGVASAHTDRPPECCSFVKKTSTQSWFRNKVKEKCMLMEGKK